MMKNIFNKSKIKQQQQQRQSEVNIPTTQKNLIPHVLDLPVFGNNGNENVAEFIRIFENLTPTMENDIKAQLLLLRLYGNAAQIIKPHLSATLTYSDMVMVLHQQCNKNIEMEEINFTEYATTIRKAINKSHPNSSGNNEKSREKLMISKFIAGMPLKLKGKLQQEIHTFLTLQQLVDFITTTQR
jgi:hypothetical protein